MPTNYGVQGPNLAQFGADTQYASPVVGQEEGIPIGGTGAGFLPSQQELRRLSEQNEKRARNAQMVQELQKIMAGIQTPSNYGLEAGNQGVMSTPGFGFEGFGGNQYKAQQMAAQNLGTSGGAVDSFSSMLDNALGIPSGGPSFGLGGGGGNYFGGGDIGSIGGGGGGDSFNFGSF